MTREWMQWWASVECPASGGPSRPVRLPVENEATALACVRAVEEELERPVVLVAGVFGSLNGRARVEGATGPPFSPISTHADPWAAIWACYCYNYEKAIGYGSCESWSWPWSGNRGWAMVRGPWSKEGRVLGGSLERATARGGDSGRPAGWGARAAYYPPRASAQGPGLSPYAADVLRIAMEVEPVEAGTVLAEVLGR